MNPEKQNSGTEKVEETDRTGRREALRKAGKLAAYAAPFTVLALTNKAEAATGHGPGKH
jgi:hypothetical protein